MTILGLFLNNQIRTGGNRRYLELMESLAERGNQVFVIMNTFLDYTPIHFTKISINIKYRRRGFPPASSIFRKKIKKSISLIQKTFSDTGVDQVDWIHIHGDLHLKAAIYLKNKLHIQLFFASRCNDILRTKILRSSHTLTLKEYVSSLRTSITSYLQLPAVARHSDLVTIQNHGDKIDFVSRTGYPADKVLVIPGNIGLPRFTPERENSNTCFDPLKLIYTGALSASKGLSYLLQAIALIKKDGVSGVRLSVLGNTDTPDARAIFRLVEALKISDMVTFHGYQNPFPYLAESGLMVYPSLYDAFPDTILEALHSGCPVMASDTGGIPDMLQYPELLFHYSDVQTIAAKIQLCLNDRDYYMHIRKLCSERAAVYRFDWAAEFEKAMQK